jgi:hypothetical protein
VRKPRNDSSWARLDPRQREAAEQWLFLNGLGYGETAARLKAEFGLEISKDSVGRYYRRRERERAVADKGRAREAFDAGAASVLMLMAEQTLRPVAPGQGQSNQPPQKNAGKCG